MASLQDSMLSLHESTASLQDATVSIQNSTAPLQDSMPPLQESTAILQDMIVSIQDSVASLQDSMLPLQESTATLQDTIVSIQDSVASPKDTTVSIQNSMAPLQDSMLPLQESTATLQDTIVSIQDSVASLQDTTVSIQNSMAPLQDSMLPLQESTATLQDTIVSIQDSVASLQDTTVFIQNSMALLQDSMLPLQESTATLQDTIVSIQDSVASLQDTTVSKQDSTVSLQESTAPLQDATLSMQDSTASLQGATVSLYGSTISTHTGDMVVIFSLCVSTHNGVVTSYRTKMVEDVEKSSVPGWERDLGAYSLPKEPNCRQHMVGVHLASCSPVSQTSLDNTEQLRSAFDPGETEERSSSTYTSITPPQIGGAAGVAVWVYSADMNGSSLEESFAILNHPGARRIVPESARGLRARNLNTDEGEEKTSLPLLLQLSPETGDTRAAYRRRVTRSVTAAGHGGGELDIQHFTKSGRTAEAFESVSEDVGDVSVHLDIKSLSHHEHKQAYRSAHSSAAGHLRVTAGLRIVHQPNCPANSVLWAASCGAVSCGAVSCGAASCGAVSCGAASCGQRPVGQRPVWGSVLWGSVLWGSVLWGSVLWGSVLWAASCGAVSCGQRPVTTDEGLEDDQHCTALNVVLRTVVVTVYMLAVLRGAAVCHWCCTKRVDDSWRASVLAKRLHTCWSCVEWFVQVFQIARLPPLASLSVGHSRSSYVTLLDPSVSLLKCPPTIQPTASCEQHPVSTDEGLEDDQHHTVQQQMSYCL
ncbi:hypothetical protein NFI96_004319 [Prochilodus magdalenae]|nr:hypothetical protein NFI96_004319 [Prochilodus magdalenae]